MGFEFLWVSREQSRCLVTNGCGHQPVLMSGRDIARRSFAIICVRIGSLKVAGLYQGQIIVVV